MIPGYLLLIPQARRDAPTRKGRGSMRSSRTPAETSGGNQPHSDHRTEARKDGRQKRGGAGPARRTLRHRQLNRKTPPKNEPNRVAHAVFPSSSDEPERSGRPMSLKEARGVGGSLAVLQHGCLRPSGPARCSAGLATRLRNRVSQDEGKRTKTDAVQTASRSGGLNERSPTESSQAIKGVSLP